MKITLEMIEAKNPCEEGLAWFNQNYPGGEVDYQELLNATVEDNELSYGIWLLNNIGPDMRVETKLHSANISGNLLRARLRFHHYSLRYVDEENKICQ